MSDKIIRAVAKNGMVRIIAGITTDLVEDARSIHECTPVAAASLGRMLTAGALLGATLKSSKEEVVLKDIPYEKEKMGEEELYCENEETVMLEDKEGNTHPYIVKELNPKVEGIVVGIRTVNEQVKKDIIEVKSTVIVDIPEKPEEVVLPSV